MVHKANRRVLELPTESIRPNPMQPRQAFAEDALRELAASIRANGILQPLTVRRTAAGWELVAGERRLRAARLAGLSTVPCLETAADSRRSALLALVENLQRQDLHYFEEAAAIAAYLRSTGATQEEAAARPGPLPLSRGQQAAASAALPRLPGGASFRLFDRAPRPLPPAAGG